MPTAKDAIKGMLQMASQFYVKDLAASTSEIMDCKPGDAHRCPFDFTYEVVKLNHLMAGVLRGEPMSAMGGEGFLTAPEEFRNVGTATREMEESMADVLAAVDGLDDAGFESNVEMFGRSWTKMEVATLCAVHVGYHDGQLNYVQTAKGDLAVHWGA